MVFVVLEERLPGSGHVIHSAVEVPVHGSLTYVPQKFFDDEQKAWDLLEQTVTTFTDKYSESREVGPLDAVVGWLKPGDLMDPVALDKALRLAHQHEPELLRDIVGEGWQPDGGPATA